MEIAKLVLEYFRLILSWPVIVGLIVVIFFAKFQASVSDLIKRFAEGEVSGVKFKIAPLQQQEKQQSVEGSSFPSLTQQEKDIVENPKKTAEKLKELNTALRFEKIFNLIFGSQFRLLEHLETKGSAGEKYVNIVPFYNQHLASTPVPPSTTYPQFLQYLLSNNLITIEGTDTDSVVKITPAGVDFLSYIKRGYAYYGFKLF